MTTPSRIVVSSKAGAVVDPSQVLWMMVDATRGWMTEVQSARTERAEIASRENIELSRIRAQKDVLLTALDLTFDERRTNFRRLFEALDAALSSADTARTAVILQSITDLAKESPFKDLANLEIVVSDLKRPDKVWDV